MPSPGIASHSLGEGRGTTGRGSRWCGTWEEWRRTETWVCVAGKAILAATQMCRGQGQCLHRLLSQSPLKRHAWLVLKLSLSLRGRQGLVQGMSGAPAANQGLQTWIGEGDGEQRTDLPEVLDLGPDSRTEPPSHGALLPLFPQFPGSLGPMGRGGGHSLHSWLWGALSAPMAFLVSPGQKSSSGVCGNGVNGGGFVLIPVSPKVPGSWCESQNSWEAVEGRSSLLESFSLWKSQTYITETRLPSPRASEWCTRRLLARLDSFTFSPSPLYFTANPTHLIL